MPKEPDFDAEAAHRYFAAHCFNASWELINEADRSEEDDEQLVARGQASLWHWTQRPDCTDQNLSVGHWLLSRIYAVIGQPAEARRYGESCLRYSQRDGVAPFYLGYAYEALARAASLEGDAAKAAQLGDLARGIADKIEEPESRKMLLDDLATI